MATETQVRSSGRPRPWLLILLAVLGLVLVWQKFSGGTAPGPVTTRAHPRPATSQRSEQVDPADLDVRVETLAGAAAPLDEGGRNPFRFQPKPPPPPPPPPPAARQPAGPVTPGPVLNPGPPPPTPIGTLIKFIGIVETGKEKIGAFSDCRYTFSGREGEIMEGRFRLVRIGVESAVVEYADGKGRTTLPLNGQACVGK
jgi:hypothetical protein